MKQTQQNVKHVQLDFRVQMLMKLRWHVRMDIIVWDQLHNVYYALMDTGKFDLLKLAHTLKQLKIDIILNDAC